MAIGKKVRGITIEFDGETTKLGKALSDVNRKTKEVDRSLKEVDRALKFNPKNTELLGQKQELLKKRVEETDEKLKMLQKTQEELDKDGSVDKNSQDYMELRREIIETESKLQHFKDQQKKFNEELAKMNRFDFEKLGKSVENVGEKMQAAGEGMSKYVTAPIVAGAGASVAAFKEVDAGLDIIVQKTGASGEALDSMKESAKNLAQEIPTDFETAGTAIGEVNTRFGLTGQTLEDLSAKFIKFAELNDTDVNNAIDMTQKALSAFGLSAEDAGGLLDQLNVVGQNTGVSMETLLAGLVQNGTAFQEMGLSADQAATMMGQMEKSGANSETVMQGLRKALKNATEEGVPLNQALAELQDTILNGKDGMDGLTAAYDLFGKSGDQIYGAVKNGTIDFSALGEAAADAAGSVEDTFEKTLDPADRFAMVMNSMKVTGYEVGATILEVVAPGINKLATFVQGLAEKWEKLDPQTQAFIVKAAGIVAAIGPVLVIVGGLVTKIGMLITFLPALAGALPAVGAAFSALLGPVGLVIAAIAAAIAIGVALYKNWDKIKEKAGQLKNWVVDKFTSMRDGVKKIFKNIKDGMVEPIDKAKDLIKSIIEKIKGFMSFKFKLPHIKLPHFAVDPPGWHLSDLLEGVVPSLGIDWYAKGGIFNSPKLIGIGDTPHGGEAALPLDPFWDRFDDMANRIVEAVKEGSGASEAAGDVVLQNNIIVDGQAVMRIMTPLINKGMQQLAVLDGRKA